MFLVLSGKSFQQQISTIWKIFSLLTRGGDEPLVREYKSGTATRSWSSILLPVYRMLTSTQGPSRMLIVRKGTHHRLNWDILDDKSTYPDLSALPGHIQLFAQFIGTKG